MARKPAVALQADVPEGVPPSPPHATAAAAAAAPPPPVGSPSHAQQRGSAPAAVVLPSADEAVQLTVQVAGFAAPVAALTVPRSCSLRALRATLAAMPLVPHTFVYLQSDAVRE
jgi:hypothetical protein